MTTAPSASIYVGRTVHAREKPFRRTFSHRIAMLDLDIDRLAEADGSARLFRVGGWAPVSFRSEDQGERRRGASLRAWAEARFAEAGLTAPASIRLIAFPRVLGFGFSPIALWLGRDTGGRLTGVIYEVHNTFGEAHAYVTPPDPDQGRHAASKEFFVSPFFSRSGSYRFTLRGPGERLELIVENLSPDGRSHVASLVARRRPLSDRTLAGWLASMPLSGLGVVVAIHWQALNLWLRGARYHHKPPQALPRVTLAVPIDGRAPTPEDAR